MNGEGCCEPFHIEPAARTAVIELAPPKHGKPLNHWILEPDRHSNRAVAVSVKRALPDAGDEGLVHSKGEERGRCVAPYPKREVAMADMGLTIRDDARPQAVALWRAPVDLERRSFADRYRYLGRPNVYAFRRTKNAVRKCNIPNLQLLSEPKPAGGSSRRKVNDDIAQGALLPERSHCEPPDLEGG